MPGRATLIFGLLFWSSVYAQELNYSRAFPTVSKNLPIRIHNTSKDYFYVLRYNRKVHDLTLERRTKPNAEIQNFTPLKLDSVNSELFNYSSLDYLLFEYNQSMYFVFEKNLNNKKTIYLKQVDSLGKSSGFTEVCTSQRENIWLDFNLDIAGVFDDKLLIISTQKFYNQSTKKTAILYDIANRRQVWSKTLPLENTLTGYSKGFCMNHEQDLFYVMVKAQILSYKRKYIKHTQVMVPEMQYDSLHLIKLVNSNNNLLRKPLLYELSALHSLRLKCDSNQLQVLAQVASKLEDKTKAVYLFSFRCASLFNEPGISQLLPLNHAINKRLKYFDGTDSDHPADKHFEFLNEVRNHQFTYHLTERKEGEVYKELLLWQINNTTGQILNHYLIPRRMLSSETWSRYSEIGKTGVAIGDSVCYLFMAEAHANASANPNTTEYYQLKKKSSLSNCHLMLYTAKNNGILSKRELHHNQDFDFIPIDHTILESHDLVFYFTNGKQEKFAILGF